MEYIQFLPHAFAFIAFHSFFGYHTCRKLLGETDWLSNLSTFFLVVELLYCFQGLLLDII